MHSVNSSAVNKMQNWMCMYSVVSLDFLSHVIFNNS